MRTYKVHGKKGNFAITIPTSPNEIEADYLKNVTADVEVAPNWSLVAILYRTPLNKLITSMKANRTETMPVIPLFVKTNVSKDNFLANVETGTPLVIAVSELSMGNHISCKHNQLSIDRIIPLLATDGNIVRETLQNPIEHYFVDFKIVPNNIIHGFVRNNSIVDVSKINDYIVDIFVGEDGVTVN